MENILPTSNQSDFMSSDSCIHQLISVTHEIHLLITIYHVLLDVFKSFDLVWHEWCIIKQNLWV